MSSENLKSRPSIRFFNTRKGAGRVKVEIPYICKAAREAFKKLDTTFYHPSQKLWSISNTEENLIELRRLFGQRLKEVNVAAAPAMPKIELNEQCQNELDRNHQKMVLKGFSTSTARTYGNSLRRFFQYFANADLTTLTKAQIEGFVYKMVSKYCTGGQAQNALINAIKCY